MQQGSRGLPVPSAQPVQQVPRDRKARKVCQAWREPLGRKGQQVQPGQLEQLGQRETRVLPARRV